MNGYELSKNWFDWCFENTEKICPNHTALYFYIIDQCNRLGWKDTFGLPTQTAKEAIGISSYKTYIKALNDLVDFGFVLMVEKSRNQHSSNRVALVKNTEANTKALTKALTKASLNQMQEQVQSNSTIEEHITTKPLTLKPKTEINFNFKNSLIDFGFSSGLVDEWMKVRKNKKATNTQTAFNKFISEVNKSNRLPDEILKICIEKDWKGFEAKWLDNIDNNYAKPKKILEDERFTDLTAKFRIADPKI